MWLGEDHDSWGLDHGTWSVLAHLFPAADVPVVQLSINANEPVGYHLELGARLAPLRERGVLVVASGNVVHNLRRVDSHHAGDGFDWAQRFDDAARRLMTEHPDRVPQLAEHDDFRAAVPTPDHFLPLLYLAGMAVGANGTDAFDRDDVTQMAPVSLLVDPELLIEWREAGGYHALGYKDALPRHERSPLRFD